MIGILPNRLELMRRLAQKSLGAEIGVYRGDFAAELLTLPVEMLVLVDSWRDNGLAYERDALQINDAEQRKNYLHVVTRFEEEIKKRRVVVVNNPSVLAARMMKNSWFDWVYLDGNHTYKGVMADLKAWAPLVKPGGFICGHDYTERPEAVKMGFGVVQAVNEFCEQEDWEMVYLTDEDWPSYGIRRMTA